jgi:glutathione S-transferase
MKLIGSLTSPYVRKVRVVMAEKKLDFQLVLEDPWNGRRRHQEQPAGQGALPGDGRRRSDLRFARHRRIPRHHVAGGQAHAAHGRERIEVRTWEALADGLLDAAILARLEAHWNGRSEEQRSQAWIDRQMRAVNAALKAMGQGPGRQALLRRQPFTLADVAVGCALGYLDFRFPQIDRPRGARCGGVMSPRGASRPAACTSSFSACSVCWWKLEHTLGLVGHHQRLLAQRVLRGHAGGAGAGVAGWAWMQPSANMKPRAALHQSAPSAIMRGDVEGADHLAGAADADAVAQAEPAQRVVHQQQALLQRRAHVVGELQRRRAGAALGAVDHDEVGQ